MNLTDTECRLLLKVIKSLRRYRWHDLRKDPTDLPPVDKYVLIAEQYGDGSLAYSVTSYSCLWNPITNEIMEDVKRWCLEQYHSQEMVIAWRYIEPFEEGNNETD